MIEQTNLKQELKAIAKELKREFAKLCADVFTECGLPLYKERELMSRRDKCYESIEQISNLCGSDHA